MSDSEKEEADKLAKAFTADREMEQTRSYLERGRSYKGLTSEELQAAWVAAGEAFIGRDDQSKVREFKDLDAEYRLRETASPAHLLKHAVDAAVERFRTMSDKDLEPVMNRIEKFVEGMSEKKH